MSMGKKLSFAIAINLLTENFKRGSNQVKAAFRSMQMQILTFAAALGAGGIGLSNLVSRFIDVARETNRVTTALKNVSGGMSQFADNQRYLLDMAKKYGLEINALTGNFAKFTAAASISGMSMMEQRKIFESVSRACTAFGMSADDSNGVFLALSQMMSKGKISSEELRLQMGERLPIALQAMAKAAGVSVGGLDKLLKQGKLLSADVLPKFADALNEMIPNVDTDNLETSVNRLKNTFTELVNSMDVQSKYKALIDWLTNAVRTAGNNIKSIINYAIAAILVMVTSRLVNKIIASIAKAELYAKAAARRAAKDAGLAFDEVAWKAQKASASIKMAFSRTMRSLKALFISSIPTAVIAILGGIVAKLVNISQEARRVRNIFSDYKKELSAVGNTAEVSQLKALQKLYNDAAGNQKLQSQYQKKIEELLGTQIKKNQNINDIVRERIKLLEAAATADFYSQKKVEAQDKIDQLSPKAKLNGISQGNFDYMMQNMARYNETGDAKALQKAVNTYAEHIRRTGQTFVSGYEDTLREISGYWQIAKHASSKIESSIKQTVENNPNAVVDEDEKKKKSALQKAEEKYKQELGEINAKLEIEKMTRTEYNKALDELNVRMYAEAKSSGDKKTLESQYFKNLQEAVRHPLYNKAQAELEKVQKDYSDKIKEYQSQQSKGLISQKELDKNIVSLSVEAAKAAAGIKDIGSSADAFIATMQFNAQMLASPIKIKPRDTTFDYKKTKVDIASENLDKAKELADAYKQRAAEIGQSLSDELAYAMANVPSLESALKIAQVKQDIKDFSKDLSEGLYSGVKDIASSSDRMVSSFETLRDVMNDVDSSGWERIMAVWNAMTNTIDGLMSIVKTIETMTELTNKLARAKEVEATIDTATTATKVTNKATEATATVAATAVETSAATTEVAANTAKGASAAGASAAKLPFPWNIVAIGGAIAAAIAAFAVIPKFASGGIVAGGPMSGDKILARVNAGEMILNQRQQSNLFRALNSGGLSGRGDLSSTVSTRVRAKDLILTINNELKSQGKKPIS